MDENDDDDNMISSAFFYPSNLYIFIRFFLMELLFLFGAFRVQVVEAVMKKKLLSRKKTQDEQHYLLYNLHFFSIHPSNTATALYCQDGFVIKWNAEGIHLSSR